MESPATALLAWDDDLAPVRLQNSYGRLVQASERDIGDTTGEERHPVTPFASWRESLPDLRKEEWDFSRGSQGFQTGEPAEWFQDAGCAQHPLQTRRLVKI